MIRRYPYFKSFKLSIFKCSLHKQYSSTAFKHDFSKNYYKILQCDRNASKLDIKNKYLELAKVLHPDNQLGSQQKFKQLCQAYAVLSDEQLKIIYDEKTKSQGDQSKKQDDQFFKQSAYQEGEQPLSNTSVEWRNTRMGVRPQSYTSYYSKGVLSQGVQCDEDITKFVRVRLERKNLQKQVQNNQQSVKKQIQLINARHKQRLKQEQQKIKEQEKQIFSKTYLGKAILGVKQFFARK